jgi:hypothetical protein
MIMNKLFGHLFGKGVVIYIDDILIFEPDSVKHKELLKQVLSILQENKLVLNQEKCLFMVNEVDFLGYHLSSTGITMHPERFKQ